MGEFWYDLSLTADESPTQNLELLECELGRMASHNIELENPTGNELFLDFKNSNPTNFEIKPRIKSKNLLKTHLRDPPFA